MTSTNSDPVSGSRELPPVTYGFIGLGNMGFPMAGNLRSKLPGSSCLVIYDVVQPAMEKFLAENKGRIEVAQDPKEVAQKCDIIITMVPAGSHVKEVFTNPTTGLLAISKPSSRKLFIECSTIDVPTSLEVYRAVDASGLGDFVDAPVSGGSNGAKVASLTFMVGGSQEVAQEIKPIVMTMGKTFHYCGGAGAGLATKQINNYMSGVCMVGISEAMSLGMKYGLDPKVLADVINASTGMSYNSRDQNPIKGISPNSSANRDFAPGFTIELCKGVLDMAVDLSKNVGVNMPLSQAVLDTFDAACQDDRCRGKDCRVVYKYIADVD